MYTPVLSIKQHYILVYCQAKPSILLGTIEPKSGCVRNTNQTVSPVRCFVKAVHYYIELHKRLCIGHRLLLHKVHTDEEG